MIIPLYMISLHHPLTAPIALLLKRVQPGMNHIALRGESEYQVWERSPEASRGTSAILGGRVGSRYEGRLSTCLVGCTGHLATRHTVRRYRLPGIHI